MDSGGKQGGAPDHEHRDEQDVLEMLQDLSLESSKTQEQRQPHKPQFRNGSPSKNGNQPSQLSPRLQVTQFATILQTCTVGSAKTQEQHQLDASQVRSGSTTGNENQPNQMSSRGSSTQPDRSQFGIQSTFDSESGLIPVDPRGTVAPSENSKFRSGSTSENAKQLESVRHRAPIPQSVNLRMESTTDQLNPVSFTPPSTQPVKSQLRSGSTTDSESQVDSVSPEASCVQPSGSCSGAEGVNQVLLSGIPTDISKDHLLNYLEGLEGLDYEVIKIEMGNKSGAAVVTFKERIDLAELKNACRKHQLQENVILQVYPADTRGCVFVHEPKSTIECFTYYFMNSRRSGGEKGVELAMGPDNRYLKVFFSCKEVAAQVAQKEHKLDGYDLRVETFDPNLEDMPIPSVPYMEEHSRQNYSEKSRFEPFCKPAGISNAKTEDVHFETKPAVSESVKGIHPAYLALIDAFIEDHTPFPDVSISIKKDELFLKGDKDNVDCACTVLENLVGNQQSSRYLSSVPPEFRGWESLFEELGGVYLAIDQYKKELCVCCEEAWMSCDQFMESLAIAKDVSVQIEAEENPLYTACLQNFLENDFYTEYSKDEVIVIPKPDEQKITVFGYVKVVNSAAKTVEQFLINAVTSEFLPVSQTQRDFLACYYQEELEKLQVGEGSDKVVLDYANGFFKISGRQRAVRQAVLDLQEIFMNLRCCRVIFTCPGLGRLEPKDWERMILDVLADKRCIMSELPDSEIEDADLQHEGWGPRAATVVHSYITQDCTVHAVDGNVLAMAVDAVVVFRGQKGILQNLPAVRRFNVVPGNGAASRTSETNKGYAHSDTSDLLVTQSGSLPCRALIQINPKTYLLQGSAEKQQHGLKSLITDILRVAENSSFSSIAIPIFDVEKNTFGNTFMLPISMAVSAIVEALTDHLFRTNASVVGDPDRNRPQRTLLQNIFLCSERAACIRAVENTLEEDHHYCGSSNPTQESYKLLAYCATDGHFSQESRKVLKKESIQIIKGDIAITKADVLVVPLDEDMDLQKTNVTRALVKRGGLSVEDTLQYGIQKWFEWNKKESPVDRRESFAEKRFLVGAGGWLQTDLIFYLYLPPWGPQVRKILTSLVLRSLKEAAEKRKKTVAFTALGGGKLSYPPQFVARTMLSVIAEYMEQSTCVLTSVSIVIFPSDEKCWRAFSSEYNQWLNCRVYPHETPRQMTASDHRKQNHERGQKTSYADVTRQAPPSPTLVYGSPYAAGAGQHQFYCSRSFQFGSVKLTLKIGNLALEQSDIIVNSTNSELDFNKGGVSRALLKTFGRELEIKCSKKHRKKMKNEGICLTPRPWTQSQKVLHVDVYKFNGLREAVLKCLSVANSAKSKTKKWAPRSIGFPLFGTGAHTHGPKEMVEALVEACKGPQQKRNNVKDIRLVVLDPRLFKNVTDLIEPHLKKSDRSQKKKPEKQHASEIKENAATGKPTSPSPPVRSALDVQLKPAGCYSAKADPDSFSLFLFSDNEDDISAAKCELGEWIKTMLQSLQSRVDVTRGALEGSYNTRGAASRDQGSYQHGGDRGGACEHTDMEDSPGGDMFGFLCPRWSYLS